MAAMEATRSRAATSASQRPTPMDERESAIQDLKRQLDTERDKNRSLEDSYKFRVASFVKRETETRNKVDSLERRLNENPESDEQSTKMELVRKMHKDVVDSLDCIQNKTAKMLQEQEKDLMRAFRHHLAEVAKEHEELKNQKGEHSSELQAKHRKVLADSYEAQGLAQGYDMENQQLQAANKKLQERARTREDDRQALLRELVVAKKELGRLKAQVKETTEVEEGAVIPTDEVTKVFSSSVPPKGKGFTEKQIEQARLQQTHNRMYEREVGYREAITKLRRSLEDERSLSRGLKEQHLELLQRRTELEGLLRQCYEDVKAEILRERLSPGVQMAQPFPSQSVTGLSVNDLTPQDRERVLELLLSQQRVVQLLYSQSIVSGATVPRTTASVGDEGRGDNFAWLGDIFPHGES